MYEDYAAKTQLCRITYGATNILNAMQGQWLGRVYRTKELGLPLSHYPAGNERPGTHITLTPNLENSGRKPP